MFCPNCGNEIPEDSKFCVSCGSTLEETSTEVPAEAPAPVTAAPKKRKKGLIALIAAVAVVALAGSAAAIILNRPEVKVPMAISKSSQAFTDAYSDMGLADTVSFLQTEKACTTTTTLTYNEINSLLNSQLGVDLSAFQGLGIQTGTTVSLEDRVLSSSLALIHKDTALLQAEYGLDDSVLWVGVPTLIGDRLGIDTAQLGQTLTDMGLDMDGMETLGFNVFDLLLLMEDIKPTQQIRDAFDDAAETLYASAQITSTGKQTVTVNGQSLSCTGYTLTFTEAALCAYLDAISEPMQAYYDQVLAVVEELICSVGAPEDVVAEALYEIRSAGSITDIIEPLKEAVAELGDVELALCLKGGYVRSVVYTRQIEEETLTLSLELGGDGEYTDLWSFTVQMGELGSVTLTSSGDHAGKSGTYTDTTELTVNAEGMDSVCICLESSYALKASGDNFSFALSVDGGEYIGTVCLRGTGQLTLEKNAFAIELGDLSLEAMNMKLISLGLSYSVREYTPADGQTEVRLINELTDTDMMSLLQEAYGNLPALQESLTEIFPDLEDMLDLF